jgi:hypothetical protein
VSMDPVQGDGLHAQFDRVLHCIAAEPSAVFLRVGVSDAEEEIAYATAVLGRLKHGYRIFQLRCRLGTRIELAYLFACVTFDPDQESLHMTTRQVRIAPWMHS